MTLDSSHHAVESNTAAGPGRETEHPWEDYIPPPVDIYCISEDLAATSCYHLAEASRHIVNGFQEPLAPSGGAYFLELLFSKTYGPGIEVTGFSEKGQSTRL